MKPLGLISIVFYVVALSFLLIKWPTEKAKTFSQNVALSKSSVIYYAVMFLIFLTLFSVFMWSWFFPEFKVGTVARYAFSAGVVTQVIAVFVPETEGLKRIVHLVAAGIMSLSVLIFTLLLSANQNISSISRNMATVAASSMLVCWLLVIFFRKSHKYSLTVQSAYFLVFFVTILLATYTAT